MSSGVQYRADVDGLRAVAVIAVLVFHAFPAHLPGGFAGVDVFFVISGYLITSILVRENTTGTFSVLRFYVRRARRLFPALLVVLLATFVAAWLFMLPLEFDNLGKHLLAGSAYISNFLLWREVGYFDPQAEAKPLLHLWSLAVEEQFYFVWPLLLWGLFRLSGRALHAGTLALLAASFALCLVQTNISQPAAFFLPLSRFWELLAGGALAIVARAEPQSSIGVRSAAGGLGLALIGTTLLIDLNPAKYPGYAAALPVLGSVLVISAGAAAWSNRVILACKPLVYIGRISYPLYLWHWPLLSIAFLVENERPGGVLAVSLLAVATILAALTERFVERPFRQSATPKQALRHALVLWITLCVCGVVGVLAWKGHISARSDGSDIAKRITAAKVDWDSTEVATLAGNSRSVVLFLGDSHMQQLLPRVKERTTAASSRKSTIELLTSPGCAPIRGISRLNTQCADFVDTAFSRANAPDVSRIVLGASWAGLFSRPDLFATSDPGRALIAMNSTVGEQVLNSWRADLARLRSMGKDVVVVLSTPRDPRTRPELLYDRIRAAASLSPRSIPRADLARSVDVADAAIRRFALSAGARVVSPMDYLCPQGQCPVVDRAGTPLFLDDSHMTASYSRNSAMFVDSLIAE